MKVRTDQWCDELLSDLLDVPYRHLVFTLPWELRLLIQDNRRVLLNVLFRAAAEAVLSLTGQGPAPRGRKSQPWLAARHPRRRYLPGMIIVLHTFGSDLKWNPHLHMIVTAGGLNGTGNRWHAAPQRYLVPGPLLGTEWKLNVLHGVRRAHQSQPLVRRRLRSDRRRRIEVDKLLGHIRKKRWHILIGPSLKSADKAVRYACRYTKRPVIAEGRIIKFAQGHVTFRFKDYHQDRKIRVRKLPVLTFIDRLVQHLPEVGFRQVRHYGLFSNLKRTKLLRRGPSTFSPEEKTPFQAPDVGAKAPGSGGQEASFLPAMWPSDGALVSVIRTTPWDRATAWDRTTREGPSQPFADAITGLSCHDLTTTARFRFAIEFPRLLKTSIDWAAQQFFCNFRPVVGQDPPFSYLGRSKGEARTETQETSTLIAGLRKGDPLRWWGSS